MMTHIKINASDNVAVALQDLNKGEVLENIKLLENIARGHKFALCDIKKDAEIIKYGASIGFAKEEILEGSHIHTHNLKTNLSGVLAYEYKPIEISNKDEQAGTFMGYLRENGDVGIRNEIWVINTVGCVNKVSEKLVNRARAKFPEFNAIYTFVHPYGCSQMGDDQLNTQKILANLVNHPNAGGVLVLGLGCENNNIDEFKKHLGDINSKRVKFMVAQEYEDEIEQGLSLIAELIEYACGFKRTPQSISKLKIGLKCGGSDGLSGITANPLVGEISDLLVSYGGITILSEVPEMFGAESILMNRCENEELFNKTVNLVNNFKEYFIRYKQEVYENPSPGNKAGGISTLEDKSLGCTQKGGTSYVRDVLGYGDVAHTSGLNLLQGPGNDIVAVTGLTAAGAHMVLFTTGRGTPLGGPSPTIKISSNSELADRKPNWIDFDAGKLLTDNSMKQLSFEFWQYIINVASGDILTKNEVNEYREIAIFKDGVTL